MHLMPLVQWGAKAGASQFPFMRQILQAACLRVFKSGLAVFKRIWFMFEGVC